MIALFPSRSVAIELFGFSVHWYGLMYLAGFLFAFFLLPRLQHYRKLSLSKDDWADILSLSIVGVLLGGRLGYVLFYAPDLLWRDPLEIFAVWNGGMSSHGGFIGVTLAIFYIVRKKQIPFFVLADVLVVPVAFGLALGRIGNFINYELYGTVTNLPWGIIIPGEEGLRHPTQFYAVGKNLFIALLCFWHLSSVRPVIPGRTLSLFFMLYGVLRFQVEIFRVQDYAGIDIGIATLSRGQVLTLPIFIIGLFLWWHCGKKGKSPEVL